VQSNGRWKMLRLMTAIVVKKIVFSCNYKIYFFLIVGAPKHEATSVLIQRTMSLSFGQAFT
jgi:hypothetical protein